MLETDNLETHTQEVHEQTHAQEVHEQTNTQEVHEQAHVQVAPELNYTSKPANYPVTPLNYYDLGALKRPVRMKETDAGLDVHFFGLRDSNGDFDMQAYTLKPQEVLKVPLGFGVGVPYGTMGVIKPRSGHSVLGIIPAEPPIDTGYTAEIHATLINVSNYPYVIEPNERIAQLVIQPIVTNTVWNDVDPDTVDSERGKNGFNSTGKF